MNNVINGIRYDPDAAKRIASHQMLGGETILYRTPSGHYFLHHAYFGNTKTDPLPSEHAAKEWVAATHTREQYTAIFGADGHKQQTQKRRR